MPRSPSDSHSLTPWLWVWHRAHSLFTKTFILKSVLIIDFLLFSQLIDLLWSCRLRFDLWPRFTSAPSNTRTAPVGWGRGFFSTHTWNVPVLFFLLSCFCFCFFCEILSIDLLLVLLFAVYRFVIFFFFFFFPPVSLCFCHASTEACRCQKCSVSFKWWLKTKTLLIFL